MRVVISSANLILGGRRSGAEGGEGLEFDFSYEHDFQRELTLTSGTPPAWSNASRNRYAVMLSYQWAKPLGM